MQKTAFQSYRPAKKREIQSFCWHYWQKDFAKFKIVTDNINIINSPLFWGWTICPGLLHDSTSSLLHSSPSSPMSCLQFSPSPPWCSCWLSVSYGSYGSVLGLQDSTCKYLSTYRTFLELSKPMASLVSLIPLRVFIGLLLSFCSATLMTSFAGRSKIVSNPSGIAQPSSDDSWLGTVSTISLLYTVCLC